MKNFRPWNRAWWVGALWLGLSAAVQAQQPPPREGSRREIKLAPEDAGAQPVVALVQAVFDALQRRDEAAVLALYVPPPLGMSPGLSMPRYLEAQRFAVWRHLKRGNLSGHRFQTINTVAQFRSGQWVPTDYFTLVVDSESDSEVGPTLKTRKVTSSFQVRRLNDGQYRMEQMELVQ